ncbi:TPA: ERF family protein, partial [Pseudomonas aeruginosa]
MQTSLKPMADSNTPIAIQESATVLQVIQKAASDPSCDIEKLERLMAMHERMQAKQAEQQYAEAMAAMQQELPAIGERGNAAGRYTYALWEDINEKLKPILAKHGFALTFRTPRNEKGVEVEGVLSHRGGHSERTSMLLPADTSGNKNAVQAVASSVSYGKRYTAGALLNYTTHGEDDDAFNAVSQQPALDQQVVIDILERI